MKNKNLGFERLEDRKVMAAYSVEVLDQQDLVPVHVENQMRSAAHHVMSNLSKHIEWKGRIDLMIKVMPPLAPHDGITPAILQNMPDPKGGWKNATVHEMLTGVDPYPNHPDVGMTVHVGNDGSVKLYGMKAYFDPNPVYYASANVPSGHFDFIGVLNHEVAHGIGFQWGTNDFSKHVIQMNGNYYFNGPETVMALGRPLPMSTFGGTHYGNYLLPNNPIRSGLMYQWGNYAGNRLDWGRLDFAILKDVGLKIKSVAGLPLVDRMDSAAPRLVISNSSINENLPIGTTVATIGSTQPGRFSFQITAGQGDFRISGNTIVTRRSFDFEARSSSTIYVRMIDSNSVWTDVKVVIRINDVKETPKLLAPSQIWAKGGLVNGLPHLRITGDNNKNVTVVLFSRTAVLGAAINYPDVKIYTVRNVWGGTTLTMVGTPSAITRSLRSVFYKGFESSIHIQMFSEGKNLASQRINLRYS